MVLDYFATQERHDAAAQRSANVLGVPISMGSIATFWEDYVPEVGQWAGDATDMDWERAEGLNGVSTRRAQLCTKFNDMLLYQWERVLGVLTFLLFHKLDREWRNWADARAQHRRKRRTQAVKPVASVRGGARDAAEGALSQHDELPCAGNEKCVIGGSYFHLGMVCQYVVVHAGEEELGRILRCPDVPEKDLLTSLPCAELVAKIIPWEGVPPAAAHIASGKSESSRAMGCGESPKLCHVMYPLGVSSWHDTFVFCAVKERLKALTSKRDPPPPPKLVRDGGVLPGVMEVLPFLADKFMERATISIPRDLPTFRSPGPYGDWEVLLKDSDDHGKTLKVN